MMIPDQEVVLLVGADRRNLVWTPTLAAHWETIARHALEVVSVTPTPVPTVWVNGAAHPDQEAIVRLSLYTATWEATFRWLALLTPDFQLAETFLCLEVLRPVVNPLVVHFHLRRHHGLLAHIASGGTFHLAMEPGGEVIPFLSVSAPGLAEQLATADAFAARLE